MNHLMRTCLSAVIIVSTLFFHAPNAYPNWHPWGSCVVVTYHDPNRGEGRNSCDGLLKRQASYRLKNPTTTSGDGADITLYEVDIWQGSTPCGTSGHQWLNRAAQCIGPHPQNNGGPPHCPAGNPIAISTGNKYQQEVDYQGSGPFPLMITRHYNSQFGGWRFNTQHHLSFTQQSVLFYRRFPLIKPEPILHVRWHHANGKEHTFAARDGTENNLSWLGTYGGYQPIQGTLETGFTIEQEGYRYHFAAEPRGQLTKIVSGQGHTHHYHYDNAGRLSRISTDSHQTLTFSYNEDDQITSIRTPDGHVYRYTYNSDKALTGVTFPGQTQARTYHYEDTRFPQHLTGITDEKGVRYATWRYDDQGRGILSEHGHQKERVTFDYKDENITTVTNALGKTTTYHFKEFAGVKQIIKVEGHASDYCLASQRSYDYYIADIYGRGKTHANFGLVKRTTDANNAHTDYTYNTRGQETRRIEASGTRESRTIETQWHPDFDVPISIKEPERKTAFTYDDQRRLLSRTITSVDARDTTEQRSVFTYNAQGLLAREDGPRTAVEDITRYTYDTQGNLSTLTNALGHRIQLNDYTDRGFPTRIVDVNGIETHLNYHARGWLRSSSVIDPSGTAAPQETLYVYDEAGLLTKTVQPSGLTLNYSYNDARHLIKIANDQGESITFTRDAAGNQISVASHFTLIL